MLTRTKNILPGALCFCALLLLWSLCYTPFGGVECAAADKNTYVGSDACMDCHEAEYERFSTYAGKRDTFDDIKRMEDTLAPEEFMGCFECHTTGYGKPGGFISEARTPHLKNPGCESCHGPGSIHAETGDPADIIWQVTIKTCETCHDPERVEAFRFSPLLHSGAH